SLRPFRGRSRIRSHASRRRNRGKASSSTLAKAGIGLAIVAILAAVGILGWQNRGLASDLLVLLGFSSRDHDHYVEKYAPAESLFAGTLKPLDLYRAATRQLSEMTNAPIPVSPTSANDMMKEQLGVNVYDFDRISFVGDINGAITVVISFKGDIPEQFLEKIEGQGTPYKSGGLKVYGTNLPAVGKTEFALVDSRNIVGVLNGTFDQLAAEETSPQTTSLVERLRASDGSIVVAGLTGPLVDDLESKLLDSGIPIPASQFKTIVAQTRTFFKEIDSFVVSTTLGEDRNKVMADMFTKPGAAIDIAAMTKLFEESKDMTGQPVAGTGIPDAAIAQMTQIFETAKFTPLENGIRFSLEMSNDEIAKMQEAAKGARVEATEEKISRFREEEAQRRQASTDPGLAAE
ncbi:MAG: hypothetical protein AAGA58_15980, partial [Verrucomicrobiota bacterium]